MPNYSPQSKARLSTCHIDLQKVFNRVIETFDHTIECGERGEREQNEAVATGHSTTPWPLSKHNKRPSDAADAMPWPYSWSDLDGTNGDFIQRKALLYCGMFIGFVLKTADDMLAAGEISSIIVSGVDWDRDWNVKEHKFIDVPHFERKEITHGPVG